jgi:hypothetical protein
LSYATGAAIPDKAPRRAFLEPAFELLAAGDDENKK